MMLCLVYAFLSWMIRKQPGNKLSFFRSINLDSQLMILLLFNFRKMMGRALGQRGHKVSFAGDGEEFLEVCDNL